MTAVLKTAVSLPVKIFSSGCFAISLLLSISIDCYGDENDIDKTLSIELFTSSQTSINTNNLLSDKHVGMKYTHYQIDRISQLQRELSQDLPKDAEQAKQLVLQRRDVYKSRSLQPDVVVRSYNELSGNPWTEIRSTLGSAQKSAANGLLGRLLPVPIDSAGNRTEGSRGNRDHRNLIFRETDVIGHPLSSLSGVLAGSGYLCESETTSFYPYFLSGLDALSWRMEIPEMFYLGSHTSIWR